MNDASPLLKKRLEHLREELEDSKRSTLYWMAQEAYRDGTTWFPNQHADQQSAAFYHAACMAGEAGEVVNKVKKVVRGSSELNEDYITVIADEVADVFTYMLELCGTLGIDLMKEYYVKREFNERRFGRS